VHVVGHTQFVKLTTQCELVLIVWFREFFYLLACDEFPFGCSSHKNQALKHTALWHVEFVRICFI
jgi:hypothetical protein